MPVLHPTCGIRLNKRTENEKLLGFGLGLSWDCCCRRYLKRELLIIWCSADGPLESIVEGRASDETIFVCDYIGIIFLLILNVLYLSFCFVMILMLCFEALWGPLRESVAYGALCWWRTIDAFCCSCRCRVMLSSSGNSSSSLTRTLVCLWWILDRAIIENSPSKKWSVDERHG